MPKQPKAPIKYKDLFLEKIRQNYQSFILGFLVFLVGLSVVLKLFYPAKSKFQTEKKPEQKTTTTEKEQLQKPPTNRYKVKVGDTLWTIAENHYGSGFNAYDIAKANKIINPDLIEVGQEIIIPSIKAKTPTTGVIAEVKTDKVLITESKYTVKQGDYLWKIALEAYGDGYQWLKIARANNLSHPDLIHAGNVLIIPR